MRCGQGENTQCWRKGLGEVRSEHGGGEREGEGQTQRWHAASNSSQALPFPGWKQVLNVQVIRLLSRAKVSVMIMRHPSPLQMYIRASDFFPTYRSINNVQIDDEHRIYGAHDLPQQPRVPRL